MKSSWIVVSLLISASVASATPPGWDLVWSDDFDSFDAGKWDKIPSFEPTNNSLQAYLPSQVSTSGGHLVILSENVPSGELPYRSGQVFSTSAQRLGRWEVRAKLPTSNGMWPAIWLLPDTDIDLWPSMGEIDIMENRGSQPNLTSSAFHYGSNPPYFHDYRYAEQRTSVNGQLANYHGSFHTYAVDWYNDRLLFYVDDVNYYTVYDQDVSNEISSSTAPMQLVLNTAIGGDFLEEPNGRTVWPQQFLIDWVKVYEASDTPAERTFSNGSFEANGGSLADWTLFGLTSLPNVGVHNQAVLDGGSALKIFGQKIAGANYSGVAQGISVDAGQQVRAELDALIRAADSLAGTSNAVTMKIEFYNHFGGKFDSPNLLDFDEILIGNSATPNDVWNPHELIATAPAGAVEARLAVVFTQVGNANGSIHIDDVKFALYDAAAAMGDYNHNGLVDAADYTVWRNSFGAEGTLLPADGSGNGAIGQEDYDVWKQHYGTELEVGSGAVTLLVPEPCQVLPLAACLFGIYLRQLPLAAWMERRR